MVWVWVGVGQGTEQGHGFCLKFDLTVALSDCSSVFAQNTLVKMCSGTAYISPYEMFKKLM